MAQFYTLDEAAARLGLPADEFKRRAKTEWTALRPFRDGATLRYRAADVDELARSLGAASDPGLALGTPARPLGDSSEESALGADSPIDLGPGSGTEDIFTLSPGDSGRGKKPAGDSDVRLTADPPAARRPTDALSLDPPARKPGGSSGRLTAPKSGPRLPADPAGPDSSSEFELALDADSDSFDLQLADDGSDAVDLSAAPAAKKGPQSGINLGQPADSGVSLEKQKDPSDLDFELSLDPPGASGVNLGGPRTGPQARATGVDSSSEFELSLDDSSEGAERLAADIRADAGEGKGDIFETDFDLPAVDESGSEVVAVEAEADDGFEVDVAEDDVAAADEDEAVALSDDDSVEIEEEAAGSPSAVRALRGVSRADAEPARVVTVAPAAWGPLPAAVLLPSLVFLFLGSLMSYEALRGMWGYHQPSKPANGLIRGVAEMVAGKVAD